jgi:molybdenum cofactor biosynthesis enzyme MoaA
VLWVQVAGTLCNLSCTHCFVSCGPHEERHAMMSPAEVAARVEEALSLGVKEIYFTGGEPFLNPDIESIVEATLAHAPVTVLSNGTLFSERRVAWLAALSRRAHFSLELRVSLDGTDEASHDAFRGAGAWRRTFAGLRLLGAAGLLPIVTFTQPAHADAHAFAARCAAVLAAEGMRLPRLKLLPMFQLGREAERSGGYAAGSTLAQLPAAAFDAQRLQCGSCRAVTSRGVFVCPLLVDEPGGRMADTLADSARPFPLAHGACVTCWVTGMSCANS